jgi:hypothetical protein
MLRVLGAHRHARPSLRAAARALQIRAAAPACAAQNWTARRAGTARSPDASRPQQQVQIEAMPGT